jgi:nuclear pore complex protein Nup93
VCLRKLGREFTHLALNVCRNYLLAKANVDAPSLASSIAALNTANTFLPLNPLHDTDVNGFLRHAHEQTLISSIEEGRRETEVEFYRNLDSRVRKDWETRKKRIFEELGVGNNMTQGEGGDREGRARFAGQHAGMRSKKAFGASVRRP